jgi:hypothetical protein
MQGNSSSSTTPSVIVDIIATVLKLTEAGVAYSVRLFCVETLAAQILTPEAVCLFEL